MEAIGDSLSEMDKINYVVRRLKGTAAEWFTIVQDKIVTYQDLVQHFRARYWNSEIQRKIRVHPVSYTHLDVYKRQYWYCTKVSMN